MEAIQDNTVYAKEADRYLPRLYYLVAWKDYPKEHLKTFSIVMHLRKIVSTFHKDYLEKPKAILAPLDFAPPMAKQTIQLPAKWKQRRPIQCAKKRA